MYVYDINGECLWGSNTNQKKKIKRNTQKYGQINNNTRDNLCRKEKITKVEGINQINFIFCNA